MSSVLTTLSADQMREWIQKNVAVEDFRNKKVLLIVPDNTRTAPLPVLFPALRSLLRPITKALDVLIALGTHPPMPQEKIRSMLGIAASDPCSDVGLFNHAWDDPAQLATIGTLTEAETREITAGVLSLEVPVEINRRILDYDIALVVGPVFPHEVVGFSGGNKYFFPGISGPKLLNFFHWLGALITNVGIIGVQDTPVRRVVDRAAKLIPIERRCLAFVVATMRLHTVCSMARRMMPGEAHQICLDRFISSDIHAPIDKCCRVLLRCTMNSGLPASACTSSNRSSRMVAN